MRPSWPGGVTDGLEETEEKTQTRVGRRPGACDQGKLAFVSQVSVTWDGPQWQPGVPGGQRSTMGGPWGLLGKKTGRAILAMLPGHEGPPGQWHLEPCGRWPWPLEARWPRCPCSDLGLGQVQGRGQPGLRTSPRSSCSRDGLQQAGPAAPRAAPGNRPSPAGGLRRPRKQVPGFSGTLQILGHHVPQGQPSQNAVTPQCRGWVLGPDGLSPSQGTACPTPRSFTILGHP